jgi:probable HAF family extracellular repeat protein
MRSTVFLTWLGSVRSAKVGSMVSRAVVSLAMAVLVLLCTADVSSAKPGPILDLGTLGGASSWGYGINSHRQVVGMATTTTGEAHAFLWSGGVMRDLGTLGGGSSVATAINDLGQVVATAGRLVASCMPSSGRAGR